MTDATAGRGRSLGLKILMVGALVVLLGIPLAAVSLLTWERSSRAEAVAAEVGAAYGGQQTVRGPYLIVPTETERSVQRVSGAISATQTETITRRVILSAETLQIEAVLETELRRRAIYETPVYRADLDFSGAFDTARVAALAPEGSTIRWDLARVVFAVSDLRGMTQDVGFAFADRPAPLEFEPGSPLDISGQRGEGWRGVSAPAPGLGPDQTLAFEASLSLSGASRFGLTASGRETQARITGDWPHPSFAGAYLPDVRVVDAVGFSAMWAVPYLARGAPAGWVEGEPFSIQGAEASAFSVNLVTPVDGYSGVGRSLKYALFFLALALLTFFLIEANGARRIHAAQYILVGLAQVVFYLLLLALSEHMSLWAAYALSAGATVILTALYALSAFRDGPRAAVTFATISVAYTLQFVLILVEDYALLIGAGVAFGAVAMTMYVTRRIDWYGLSAQNDKPAG